MMWFRAGLFCRFSRNTRCVTSCDDVKKCFSLLGLQTYLTTGVKETRAWTIRKGDTAPKAAGVIHPDFERGFIRSNIVSYDDLVKYGSMKEAREKGLLRQEGKEYIMQDGDVVEFLFNV